VIRVETDLAIRLPVAVDGLLGAAGISGGPVGRYDEAVGCVEPRLDGNCLFGEHPSALGIAPSQEQLACTGC
jgi:hypothetical protein